MYNCLSALAEGAPMTTADEPTETAAPPDTCTYTTGCTRPRPPADGGRRPKYCGQADGPGQPVHNRYNAWRETHRPDAEQHGAKLSEAQLATPVTTARRTGADLLRDGNALAARLADVATLLREELGVITDPAMYEAETENALAEANQRVAAANQRVAAAEQRATQADGLRAAADEAVEEVAEDRDRAQAAARQARDDLAAAVRAHAEEIERIQAEADERIAAAENARNDAITKAGQADQRATRAEAAAEAARGEITRIRDEAARQVEQVREDAERQRGELRAALEARVNAAEER